MFCLLSTSAFVSSLALLVFPSVLGGVERSHDVLFAEGCGVWIPSVASALGGIEEKDRIDDLEDSVDGCSLGVLGHVIRRDEM